MALNFLKELDFIGKRPRLSVNNTEKFKTTAGGLISILVFVGTFSISIYFGREVWQKTSPVVNRTIQVSSSPSPILLDKINFDMFFGMQYSGNLFIDNTLYNLTMNLRTFHTGIGFVSQSINLEPCSNSSFAEETFDLFSKYSFNGGYCVSKNNTNLQISKLFGQEGYNFIEIIVYPCINSTSNDNFCKPQSIIDNKLASNYFSFYSMNNYIQTDNYENPYNKAIYNGFAPVSNQNYISSVLFLYHTQVNSDVGFLFTDLTYIYSYSIDSYTTQYYSQPKNNAIFELSIQLQSYEEVYIRSYMKLQVLMAQIGGIANLFMIVGSILVKYFTNLNFKLHLVNYCYDLPNSNIDCVNKSSSFDQKGNIDIVSPINLISMFKIQNYENIKNESFKNDRLKNQQKSLNDLHNNNKCNNNFEQESIIRESIYNNDISKNNLINSKEIGPPKNRNKIVLNFFEKLFFCFENKKKNIKKLLLEENYIPIKDQLSFESFLDLIRTVSIMRYFLFSRFDNNLIDYLGNPLLNLENSRSVSQNSFQQMYSFINRKYEPKLNNSSLVTTNNSNILDAFMFRP